MASSANKKKRLREVSNVNVDLVEIYEDLANENGEIRLKAAVRLLSMKFEGDHRSKTLSRLFRGLCSSRKAARLGFSVALTEFLTQYTGRNHDFTPEIVLQVYEKQTDPASGASGQELRDYYFGRLFAAEAIIKSNVFHNTEAIHVWPHFVNLILDLYEKKSWLREESGWILYQALQGFDGQSALFDAAAAIFQQLELRKLLRSPEAIALWTLCRVGNFERLKLPLHVFRNDNPLDGKERAHLMAALKGTATVANETETPAISKSSTTWSNKIHFAWTVIFDAAMKMSTDGMLLSAGITQSDTLFGALWHKFVDEYLFANSASEQRKYWGFLMVQHYLKQHETAGHIFGSNFLRCFANQLAKSDRHLHGIAVKTLKAINAVSDADEKGHYAGKFLMDIVATRHNVDFDRSSKTKLVEKMLAKASPFYQKATVEALSMAISTVPASIDRSAAQWQIACADFLLACVKNYKTARDVAEREENYGVMKLIIRILTSFGYCENILHAQNVSQHKLEIDQHTREVFRTRLTSALSHLITQDEDPSELPALSADILLGLEKQYHTQPISQSPQTVLKAIQRAGRRMRKCGKKAASLSEPAKFSDYIRVYKMFRLLLALSIIQTFSGDADAVDVLGELEVATKSILDDHDNDSDQWVSVVEIILSLSARPSLLFRRVGKEVFSSCSAMLDINALEPLFNVLNKKENLSGQQALFDANDNESLADDSRSGDSDVQDVNSELHPDGDSSLEDDGDNGDSEEILEFENKLAQALGTHKVAIDSNGGQEAEDEDEDIMDDEQMTALDPVMSNIFKQRKQASSKKEHKNAKETIVTFKSKVLELLEIYVRQLDQGSNVRTSVAVLLHCLECIKDTQSKQVSEKAASVVKTALNVYKLRGEVKADRAVLREAKKALHTVHQMVLLQGSNAYLRACSQASLFCAKSILNNGGMIGKIWKEYSRTAELMATSQNCKIVTLLFQDWFNWLGTAKITLSKRTGNLSADSDGTVPLH